MQVQTQNTLGGNDTKSLQRDALQQMYDLMAENQSERNQTLKYLDEEINLTRERQQYSFWDKLASVMTLGLYAMVKEACDKWEIEALQEEKKEVRMERLEDLKQLKEIRNALKDASDRAYSGNKWYIPEDRFNNLENLVKSSKMLDERTRTGLTNYLDVMKDIEKNRTQEKNHSKILEKANENILIGNAGTGYGSFAEKRLNGLKGLAKDMLKTKGLSEEDRKFCEKLTNLTPESESALKEKLEKPNAFKNFDELKSAVSTLQEKPKIQTVEATQNVQDSKQTQNVQSGQENKTQSNQAINNPEDRKMIPGQVQQTGSKTVPDKDIAKKIDEDGESIDLATDISEHTPLNQPQAKKVQQTQVVNQQDSQTQSVSQVPNSLVKTKSQTSQSVIDAKQKVTSITREVNGNVIRKDSKGNISVLNQEKASQMAKQVLKAQGHGIDDRKQVNHNDIQIGFKNQISVPSVQGGGQQIQNNR